MKTRKKYEIPLIEILEIETEQILAASGEDFNEKPGVFSMEFFEEDAYSNSFSQENNVNVWEK